MPESFDFKKHYQQLVALRTWNHPGCSQRRPARFRTAEPACGEPGRPCQSGRSVCTKKALRL